MRKAHIYAVIVTFYFHLGLFILRYTVWQKKHSVESHRQTNSPFY